MVWPWHRKCRIVINGTPRFNPKPPKSYSQESNRIVLSLHHDDLNESSGGSDGWMAGWLADYEWRLTEQEEHETPRDKARVVKQWPHLKQTTFTVFYFLRGTTPIHALNVLQVRRSWGSDYCNVDGVMVCGNTGKEGGGAGVTWKVVPFIAESSWNSRIHLNFL